LNPELTLRDRNNSEQTALTRQTKTNEPKRLSEHPPSMLSFIYDEVTQRMKNIEDFGAPLSQLSKVL
jgi:hypothetical protein